jgi:ribosomal protein L7Ae-like RNA K-turn-binding protein
MNDPLLNLLGLAMRAGRLSAGYLKSSEAAASGKARLIIVASDISAKTAKEADFVGGKHNIPCRRVEYPSERISHAIGIKSGVVSINDDGFAKKALSLIDNK